MDRHNAIEMRELFLSHPLGLQSAAADETVDIWTAAANGNLEMIKEHITAGVDINAKDPSLRATPLMAAAIRYVLQDDRVHMLDFDMLACQILEELSP